MSLVCTQCAKRPGVGHTVSHSNIKTLRRFKPNIVKKRVFDEKAGKMVAVRVCTACLRSMVKVRA